MHKKFSEIWHMTLMLVRAVKAVSFISLFADVAIAKGICGLSRNIDWSGDLWCNSYENWMFFSVFRVNFVIGSESTFSCRQERIIGGIRRYSSQTYRSCVRDLTHTIHEKFVICKMLNFYRNKVIVILPKKNRDSTLVQKVLFALE